MEAYFDAVLRVESLLEFKFCNQLGLHLHTLHSTWLQLLKRKE